MDAPRRALWTSFLLLPFIAALPGSGAAQLTAHPIPTRDGFWFSGGLGTGVGEGGVGGLAGNFTAGWTPSPRLLIGIGTSDLRAGLDEFTAVMVGTLDVRLQFYPR